MVGDARLFLLSSGPIDPAALAAELASPGAGACVTFEGRVRDTNDGMAVEYLEYEAYEALALDEGRRVVEECLDGVIAARCVHRVGRLEIGDVAVWVGVIAAHRGEAFAACRRIIDEVKSRVPIWKKEHYRSGAAQWVAPLEER